MALEAAGIVGGIALGTGVGQAVGDVVTPKLQDFKNQEWTKHADVPLSAHEAAELVAQHSDSPYASYIEALNTGYGQDRFDALTFLSQSAPDIALTLELWRREKIDRTLATKALHKAGLLPAYIGPLLELFNERLDPQAVAVMVQRGILPNPELLPVGPPTEVGAVPPMPVVAIDPVMEAQAHGIDKDRIAALARIVGLPASPDLAARMVFRRIIERVDFDRAISEGNTRNEWAPFLFEGFREILTAHDYAELELRGYYDRSTRLANTAKHGMSDADSDLLYDVLGRSIPVHQITTGLARGGVFNGPTGEIPTEYLQSLQRGNLRPEYYNLAYANRYSFPSAFVLRAITQAGEISETQAHTILLEIGWPPWLADTVSKAWAGGTTGTKDKHVASQQTRLVTTLHKSYVADKTGETQARDDLTAAGLTSAEQEAILALWNRERELVRKDLTASQIRKAFTLGTFTRDQALARLSEQGYSAADANTYLNEA